MTDLEKAARMVLEALDKTDFTCRAKDAITALRQALSDSVEQPAKQRHIAYVCPQCHWTLEEQPADEPVACIIDGDLYHHHEIDWEDLAYQGHGVELLYTRNRPAAWIGLTDDDLEKVFPAIATYHEANKTLYRSIARAIETKLKEKNT